MKCQGILAGCLYALLLAGCASYRIPTPCGEARVATLFKDVSLPRIEYSLDGSNMTIAVEGYTGAADEKAITATAASIGAIAGAAAKAAAK